jgi:hypothetical protein
MVKPILIWLCDNRRVRFIGVGSGRLSKRRVIRFVILGAAAVTLAGYSAYAKRANRAMAADQAVSFAERMGEPQTSNRAAKTDRLFQTALIDDAARRSYALASLQPDMERPADPVIAATPSIPAAEPAPAAEAKAAESKPIETKPAETKPVETKTAVLASPSPSYDKPKPLPPTPAPHATGLLDDGQIAGLKGRLRLTSDQVEYWPAVEAALRDVVRKQLRGTRHVYGGKVNIDTNSPEVQKLIWAAMPLLMRLRDDQKSEVRKLARVIGLDQVAAQI